MKTKCQIYLQFQTVNDLHRKPYIAQYVNNVFQKGLVISRLSDSYQGICNSTQCIIYVEGCSRDPVICSTALHIVSGVLLGLSLFIASYFIAVSEIKNPRIFFKCMPLWFQTFFISHRNGRFRRFSFLYAVTVLFFNSFVLFLGDKSVFGNDTWCQAVAGVHYFLYLSIMCISTENMFILTNAVGDWKPWYNFMIFIFSGLDNHVVRGLYSFLIPLFITGIFGLTMPTIFYRKDYFCWIRSDYKFPSLWLPLIFIGISFVFYIPIFARCYRRNIISKFINRVFAKDGEYCDSINIDRDEKQSENYLSSKIISWTLIPQLLLAIAAVSNF